ncbi:ead/Ea22-like family protein [Klebsiella michiganensis]|uniref:ead/Ea22-like family protein n=1 Tax=Klebsiella michiganensis TaxID=1134687 RepID=UPI001D0ECE67|nr:ead/Ea22-like family protein [Klebsiella michiganensis]
MTTDITELAQRLKAAAEKATQGNWRAFQYHDGRCGIGGGHNAEIMVCEHISKERPHDAMFIALASPANILALVEALEKARQSNTTQREYYEGVIADGSKRIAELESEVEKWKQESETWEQVAEKQLATDIALESRTVKLPEPHAHLIWIQAGHAPDDFWDDVAVSHSEKDRCCDGSERYPVYARWEIEEALAAAGIKVETE